MVDAITGQLHHHSFHPQRLPVSLVSTTSAIQNSRFFLRFYLRANLLLHQQLHSTIFWKVSKALSNQVPPSHRSWFFIDNLSPHFLWFYTHTPSLGNIPPILRLFITSIRSCLYYQRRFHLRLRPLYPCETLTHPLLEAYITLHMRMDSRFSYPQSTEYIGHCR